MNTEERSTIIVGIRFTPQDVKDLKELARKKRLTLSGLIRERIFQEESKINKLS